MGDIVKLPANGERRLSMKQLSEPPWLGSWQASEKPPVTAEAVRIGIERYEAALLPAEPADIAAALEPLAHVFDPPPAAAGPIYVSALSDIPREALALAVQRCIQQCKFYPRPVEIRERADEYDVAIMVRQRLRTALWVLTRGW